MMFVNAGFRIRSSIRAFANTPAVSIALVVTIAIGVGSNAIVGGFIAGLAHPRLPIETSGRMVSIFARDRLSDPGPLSETEFYVIRSHMTKFSWVSALRITPIEVSVNGHSETLTVAAVMPDLARALHLNFDNGVVVSDRLWGADFDGEASGTKQAIEVNHVQLSIAGIAPKALEGLYGDRPIDIWLPFGDGNGQDADGDRRDLWVFASLRDGVSISDAQSEIRSGLKTSGRVDVIPYQGVAPGTAKGLASIVTLLGFIAGAVFVISCINVASLLLGRAFERSSETSLRVALGATRRALCGELLADSVVVAFAGGLLGLLLAMGAKRILPSLLFQEDAERLNFVPPVASLIASSLICVGIMVLAGMAPIFATVADRPWMVLQREQGFSSTRIVRVRAALVVIQIALCCALVIFATLLFQGFQAALKTGIGQRLGNPILVTVQASPMLNYRIDYFNGVEQSAKSFSNGAAAAWTSQLPGGRPMWRTYRMQPATMALYEVDLDVGGFNPDSQGQPEEQADAGRIFNLGDGTCEVAVVNRAAAGALQGGAIVGERIFDPAGLPVGIIGVVNTASRDVRSSRPTIYFNPLSADGNASMKGARFRVPAERLTPEFDLNVDVVSSGYMQALALDLVSGHWFSAQGQFSDPCRRVGVINQEAADLYFGGKPLGAGIIDQKGDRTEIIGVIRSQNLGVFQRHAEPTVFIPAWQEYPLRMTLIVGAVNPSGKEITEFRRNIESLPGHAGSVDIRTMDAQLAGTAFAPLRIATLIALTSALAALTVSMMGVFSMQRQLSSERRKILALHLAFGAQRWRILLRSVVESGRLVFLGCVAGALLSIALRRILLSETGLIGQPTLRAWLLAMLLPAVGVLISGALVGLRSLGVQPMAVMRDR
jgi:ABC-type lipoprotein release transport system permease subunit